MILVNGEPAASISVLDRGLHYGDGLFETIACIHGRPRFLTLHLDRLTHGCQRLAIPAPDSATLRAEVEHLASQRERSIVKVMLTRGEAVARGYAYSGTEKTTRISFLYDWPPESDAAVKVRTASIRLGENAALAGLKHLSRLEQVLARAQLNRSEESELLMFSSSGRLISGTMSNVFVVHGDRLRTPRLDLCGVAGVMRRVVLREAPRCGIAAAESDLSAADLASADEVFLSNARIGMSPVNTVDGRAIKVGPVTRRLQEALAPLLAEPADA